MTEWHEPQVVRIFTEELEINGVKLEIENKEECD